MAALAIARLTIMRIITISIVILAQFESKCKRFC